MLAGTSRSSIGQLQEQIHPSPPHDGHSQDLDESQRSFEPSDPGGLQVAATLVCAANKQVRREAPDFPAARRRAGLSLLYMRAMTSTARHGHCPHKQWRLTVAYQMLMGALLQPNCANANASKRAASAPINESGIDRHALGHGECGHEAFTLRR
jgi:hypothetical protein